MSLKTSIDGPLDLRAPTLCPHRDLWGFFQCSFLNFFLFLDSAPGSEPSPFPLTVHLPLNLVTLLLPLPGRLGFSIGWSFSLVDDVTLNRTPLLSSASLLRGATFTRTLERGRVTPLPSPPSKRRGDKGLASWNVRSPLSDFFSWLLLPFEVYSGCRTLRFKTPVAPRLSAVPVVVPSLLFPTPHFPFHRSVFFSPRFSSARPYPYPYHRPHHRFRLVFFSTFQRPVRSLELSKASFPDPPVFKDPALLLSINEVLDKPSGLSYPIFHIPCLEILLWPVLG